MKILIEVLSVVSSKPDLSYSSVLWSLILKTHQRALSQTALHVSS